MYPCNPNSCLNSDVWLEKASQKEYRCHTPQFPIGLREKICIHCRQRKPASLEETAFFVIMMKPELLNKVGSTLRHLPHRICWLISRALNANLVPWAWKLVAFLPEYDETWQSWFDVDDGMTGYLSRFRLYCEVNQKLKPYMTSRSAGLDTILGYFVGNVYGTGKGFWSTMAIGMEKWKAETEKEDCGPLKNIICEGENNVVLIKAAELTPRAPLSSFQYWSMKHLQRLNKIILCPVVFKPTTIDIENLKSHEIPNILEDIDTQVIADVDIAKKAWSVADIDELGRVLSECNSLSSIYLEQESPTNEVLEDLAAAVSRLLSHHHHLQEIGFAGFKFDGTLVMHNLPPVETLRFRACAFEDEDFDFLAKRSDLVLKHLIVSSYFEDDRFPSLPIFIQNQAKSLETLELEYPTVSVADICHLLRIMAKFNVLQKFYLRCFKAINFIGIETILVDLMSIHSTQKFHIDTEIPADFIEYILGVAHLNGLMVELCKTNRRPPIKITRRRLQ